MGSFCTPSYSELPSSSDTYSADEVPSWVLTYYAIFMDRNNGVIKTRFKHFDLF